MDGNRPAVFVVTTDYAAIGDAVEKVFARFPLNVRDKLVWVKPNMLGNFKPERHVTTHPALVSAVVKKLISLGARVVVGDNGGLPGLLSEDKYSRESGIADASHGMFRVISQETASFRIENGSINETVLLSKIARDCDLMISLPKMKTHLHTFITGAVKNSYGMVVGVQKPNLHKKHPSLDDFAGVVSEIYALRKPDLVIMDGIVAMEGDGPNAPTLRDVGRVIASTDGVALDHYMARVMGFDAHRIPLLTYCVERGFGSADYDLEGAGDVIKHFKAPRTYHERRDKRYSAFEGMLYDFVTSKRLRIDRTRCIRCMRCAKMCVSGAITIDEYPSICSGKCILCYCCREICPVGAVRFSLKYRLGQRAISVWEKMHNVFRPRKS